VQTEGKSNCKLDAITCIKVSERHERNSFRQFGAVAAVGELQNAGAAKAAMGKLFPLASRALAEVECQRNELGRSYPLPTIDLAHAATNCPQNQKKLTVLSNH
jgi:hypothetical protein